MSTCWISLVDSPSDQATQRSEAIDSARSRLVPRRISGIVSPTMQPS